MAKIVGIDGMTVGEVVEGVKAGGRFVLFEYCFSIIVMTFKRGTDVYYIPPGGSTASKSLPYTLLTLLLGWWGFPWGFIYTPMAIATNLGGGRNVTKQVLASLTAGRPA